MRRFPLSVQRAVHRGRRLLSTSNRAGQLSATLGAALLLGSTLSVVATANSSPEIISMNLSQSVINEGDTVTVTGTFTDPDPSDWHTIHVGWRDGSFPGERYNLPPGQFSFQISHTYRNNNNAYPGGLINVRVKDHQLPPGANDNTESHGEDWQQLPLTVNNVAPSFNDPTIKVTKAGGKSGGVVVEGTLTEPGTADTLNVIANWGDGAPGAPKPLSACTVNQHSRAFRCEHAYKTTPAKSYHIALVAQDPDGGEDTAGASIQIP